MGKERDDRCEYCGEVDTVKHTMFKCIRWDIIRDKVWMYLE